MSIQTAPTRLAKMLVDSHPAIKNAFDFTKESIDQDLDRPCWLIFIEDASYENVSVDQSYIDQGFSLAFVGAVYSGTGDFSLSKEYEVQTREIADDTVRYLLEHPQLQMSNTRSLFADPLYALNGIMWTTVDSRSAVTLFSRDAVASEIFWGFTIDMTVRMQFAYDTVAL